MPRSIKVVFCLGLMALFGFDACLSAYTSSWGWVACFTMLFAFFSWDLSKLIWPAMPDHSKPIRPRWKL